MKCSYQIKGVTFINRCMRIIVSIILTILIVTFIPQDNSSAQVNQRIYTKDEILKTAQGIINWKKADNGSGNDGNLINNKFLELAGSTPGDWYPIGLSRLGAKDDYEGYLAVIKQVVSKRYSQKGKLSSVKSTEWHRISLSVLATGGNPLDLCDDERGNAINLIADGTYNRGKTTSLGRQGINGWIWGLIALDAKRYEIPKESFYSREDIITEIMGYQLKDGGFTLSGNNADTDITAMVIQSLSPYYNSEKKYTYTQKSTEKKVSKTVYQVIEESLNCLSDIQLETGDFKSWGTQNVESTDQVIIALCCLGINPQTDKRFIKTGKTLIDGIMSYKKDDGGFIHSFSYDESNPSSLPEKSNTMSGEQTLCALAAVIRQIEGKRTLYDFRNEQSEELKNKISLLENKIDLIDINTDKNAIEKLVKEFYSIKVDERSYVNNYRQLSEIAYKKNINIDKIASSANAENDMSSDNNSEWKGIFSTEDKKAVENLPKKLSTKEYVTIIKLIDKINSCQDFEGKEKYIKKLSEAKKKVENIQTEINNINSEIKNKLYPFNDITIKDKPVIDNLSYRYGKLSDYDKNKIERWEDVIKAKTKVDNKMRGIIISAVLVIVCVLLVVLVVRNIKKRKKLKQSEMEKLAEMFEDKE